MVSFKNEKLGITRLDPFTNLEVPNYAHQFHFTVNPHGIGARLTLFQSNCENKMQVLSVFLIVISVLYRSLCMKSCIELSQTTTHYYNSVRNKLNLYL